MIEVRLFATFRENRNKVDYLESENFTCGKDIIKYYGIDENDVAIFLINGFHSTLEDVVKDSDVVAIFPPVGGG